MSGLKVMLTGLMFALALNPQTRTYIPISAASAETSDIILEYSFEPGANRPSAALRFSDGFRLDLNAVSEGEYSWSMRIVEDSKVIDLGSLKMEFPNDKTVLIQTKVNDSTPYLKYLELIPGEYKRVK